MPFAGFKDFDDCLAKMKAKGHDEESARKICGSLQAKVEKKEKKTVDGKIIVAENVRLKLSCPITVKEEAKKDESAKH